ncbi:MAG: nucleoside-diphosphate sugar epimerase/dehydratase [Arenicellales bacterium]|jgi:FlaA1/EpsC-like NDP-sugar epimerase|nr:nucleoside-diphosphate sugar epimerase/dehydratase [Arenicellales bacterium]MDP6918549.1 nucleoside-diphosphate sugar epimerase/dehydratase [Arenicellales bacterium]
MERSALEKLLSAARYLLTRWPVLLHDAMAVCIAWLGAYWFRFNLDRIPDVFLDQSLAVLPLVVFWHLVFFVVFGVHRGAWRFTSTHDLSVILKSVVVGTAVVAFSIFLATRLVAVPRSVFPLHGVFLVGLLIGTRILYRLFRDRQVSRGKGKRVLIVGAGTAGDMLLRDLGRNHDLHYDVVGFIDDDQSKKGREIHGVRVLDRCAAIPQLARLLRIELILIAVPSASTEQMRSMVEYCERSATPFRTLPKVQDILGGTASSADLRSVELDDLLGRDPVDLDWDAMARMIKDRRVLITGGAGSIGSELCRQVARLEPAEIILLEQNEFNLYSLALELEERFPSVCFWPLLGDVCDPDSVRFIFSRYRPEIVFHAAAYKHVPMLQDQVRETIRNNTVGTMVTAKAAVKSGVEKFVLISTDKAVNPTSMMGVSKRLAEMVAQLNNSESNTAFVTVRFGNVLGSAGSVVPLFERQIQAGGPVTVTDPMMTRYFMTTSEACQLILQACAIGEGGEIFVLNMGEPVKIDYLARQMIRLSGKVPDEEIEIKYTGLRPGEKLTEELFHPDEDLTPTSYDKILLARSRSVDNAHLVEQLAQLRGSVEIYKHERAREIAVALVPEYRGESDDSSQTSPNQAA